MIVKIPVREPLNDHVNRFQLYPEPAAVLALAHRITRTAAAEWIAQDLARYRTHLDHAIEHLGRERVGAALLGFELPMANWGNVVPHVGEVHAGGVHRAAVTAIVLDLAAAVPARLDRRADAPERLGLPFGVVDQAVVARVQSAGDW